MTPDALSETYRGYITCVNAQDWDRLGDFVHAAAVHNGRALGLDGYREMLREDFRAIPDLSFRVALLVAQPPRVASRLEFDCTPRGMLFGLPVNGRRVRFAENVFYTFEGALIREVHSVIETDAIRRQLSASG